MEVELDSLSLDFPIFVSQVLYTDDGERWKETQRVLPGAVAPWEPTGSPEVSSFRFAEGHVIGHLDLAEVPDGLVYVPQGPYFRSAEWRESGEKLNGPKDREWFKITCLKATRTVADTMDHGFLIGADEARSLK